MMTKFVASMTRLVDYLFELRGWERPHGDLPERQRAFVRACEVPQRLVETADGTCGENYHVSQRTPEQSHLRSHTTDNQQES